MAKFLWLKSFSLNSIKSQIIFVFIITIAILLLMASFSLLAITIFQNNVEIFIQEDLTQIIQVDKLASIVPNIVANTNYLIEAKNKEYLNKVYGNIDAQLLALEKLTTLLSSNSKGIAPQLLKILVLSQQIRAESQLSLQLTFGALDAEARLFELNNIIDQILSLIHTEIFKQLFQQQRELSLLKLQEFSQLNDDAKVILDIMEKIKFSQNVSKLLLEEKQSLQQALSNNQRFILSLSEESQKKLPELKIEQFLKLNADYLFNLKNRELELRETATKLFLNLQNTVAQLVRVSEDYTNIMLQKFANNIEFIKNLNNTIEVLIILMMIIALSTIILIQWRLLNLGLSRRLEVISRFLLNVPTEYAETQVPVNGNDEIGLMARSLERLLMDALKIHTLATIDDLTKVSNRRHFFQKVEAEAERAKTLGISTKAAIMILDIDFFKQINDNYGHDIGDIVLIKFAKTCQHFFRSIDIFARLGGEEFIVYCPDIEGDDAKNFAEMIRHKIESLIIEVNNGLKLKITISIGVAICPSFQKNLTLSMKYADQALYEAKKQGRNCVVLSEIDGY